MPPLELLILYVVALILTLALQFVRRIQLLEFYSMGNRRYELRFILFFRVKIDLYLWRNRSLPSALRLS
jgi:hypothetical protein